jgi:hypothetical protein
MGGSDSEMSLLRPVGGTVFEESSDHTISNSVRLLEDQEEEQDEESDEEILFSNTGVDFVKVVHVWMAHCPRHNPHHCH